MEEPIDILFGFILSLVLRIFSDYFFNQFLRESRRMEKKKAYTCSKWV